MPFLGLCVLSKSISRASMFRGGGLFFRKKPEKSPKVRIIHIMLTWEHVKSLPRNDLRDRTQLRDAVASSDAC